MRYVDHDGTVKMLVCHCGKEIDWHDRDDGSQVALCEDGHWFGLKLDMGELDLGVVREAVQEEGDVVFYGEDSPPFDVRRPGGGVT